MKSWICKEQGFEHVIFKTDEPFPKLEGPDDDYKVIVKLIAASVNPVDFKRCSMGIGFPAKLGSDILGEVVQIGPKVDEKLFVPNKTWVLAL